MRQLLQDSQAEPQAEPIAESAAQPPKTAAVKAPHPTLADRWSDGTLRAGNQASRKRPAMRTDNAAVQQQLREATERHIADRGGKDNLTAALVEGCGVLAFVGFALHQWEAHFLEMGFTTRRGRVRSSYASYLATVDRYVRLLGLLGLERRARPATETPVRWLERLGREQAEEQEQEEEQDGATKPAD